MFRKGQNNYVLDSKERVRKGKKNSCAIQIDDSKEGVRKGKKILAQINYLTTKKGSEKATTSLAAALQFASSSVFTEFICWLILFLSSSICSSILSNCLSRNLFHQHDHHQYDRRQYDRQQHDHHDFDHHASLLFDHLFYLVELPEQESYLTTWSTPTWSSPICSSTTWSSWLWSSSFSPLQSSLLSCQTVWAGLLILC